MISHLSWYLFLTCEAMFSRLRPSFAHQLPHFWWKKETADRVFPKGTASLIHENYRSFLLGLVFVFFLGVKSPYLTTVLGDELGDESYIWMAHFTWSNHSDLTWPHCDLGPQKVAFWKGNLRLLQGNLGWWNIIVWPDSIFKGKGMSTPHFLRDDDV